MKRNGTHLLWAAVLFALAFLLVLNGRGDMPAPDAHGNTPEQVLALKKFEPQLTNLANEYKMALKSPEGARQFQATIRKAMANIDAAGKPVKTNGNNLPASFTDIFFPNGKNLHTSDVDCFHVGLMGLTQDNYVDQLTLVLAGKLIVTAPDILMPVFQERAKVFPPTVADYILFGQISDAIIAELDDADYSSRTGIPIHSDEVFLSSTDGLMALAQGKNPIYRLLVAGFGMVLCTHFCSNPSEAEMSNFKNKTVSFYSVFLNEPDPIILGGAIDAIAGCKTPAATSLLQSFLTAAQKNGDTKRADLIRKAIQRIKN